MKYVLRAFFAAVALAIVGGCVLLVMTVVSKRTSDLYGARVQLAFNAATLEYASGDAATTVVTECGGTRRELDPENYRALSYYMRKGAVKSFFPASKSGEHIRVVICDTDTADIYRLSDEKAYIVFSTGGETMKMRVHDDGLWAGIAEAALDGLQTDPNIVID